MANIKITGNTWDASGIYDSEQEKTQSQVNSDIKKIENVLQENCYVPKWARCGITAVGHSVDLGRAVSSLIKCSPNTTINCDSNAVFALFFYDANDIYLGKVAANGSINKTSGDWKNFTGKVVPLDWAPNGTVYFQIDANPTDGTVLNNDNVATWANSHVSLDVSVIEKIDQTLSSSTEQSKQNLVDQHNLLSITNTSIEEGSWYSVIPGYANSKYGTDPFPTKAFKENTQYTLSFDAKYTGTVGTTLRFLFVYSDDTGSAVTVTGADEKHYTLISSAGKTVTKLCLTCNNSVATFVKNLMIVEGTEEPPMFIPYGSTIAIDTVSRVLTKNIPQLEKDMVTALSADTGIRHAAFNVNASATHSSALDQIPFVLEKDEYFYVVYSGAENRTVQVFCYGNGTQTVTITVQNVQNMPYLVKASQDTSHIGLFVGAGEQATAVTFMVFKADSIYKIIPEEYNWQYEDKLNNAIRKSNSSRYSSLTSPEIFAIAHFSDIHGNGASLNAIQRFKNRFSSQIDDVICTGDLVADKLADGLTFWNNNSDGSFLICVGNHDSLGSSGWSNPASQETLYNTYIEPYEENWNAETVLNHSYWYKDYASKKIRLICLDATIFDATEQAAQMTWLSSALNGARTNEYSVVGAIHFPPLPSNFQKIESNFTSLLHGTATDMSQFAWYSNSNSILGAVDDFINAGGDFVCWLCGHTHNDLVCYDSDHPKQLFITISTASSALGGIFEERARNEHEQYGILLNTVCVDTVRKYVKLLRYGAEWDDCLRHTGTCVIRYNANPPVVVYQN